MRKLKQEMTSITLAWPFYQYGIDNVGPLPLALGGARFLVVAIDYFTKWVDIKPPASMTGKHMEKFVWEHIVCKFVIPHVVISDNRKLFAEGIFPVFCQKLERRLGRTHQGWVDELQQVLWAHRTTPKYINRETPFNLIYGSEAVVPIEISVEIQRIKEFKARKNEKKCREDLDILEEKREIVSIREAYYKQKLERYYNKCVRPSTFKQGTYVLRLNSAIKADKGPTYSVTNYVVIMAKLSLLGEVFTKRVVTTAFMANLSFTSGTNSATIRRVNEVSSVSPGEISMITILDDLRNQLDGHLKVNQEQSMVNDSLRAELARCSSNLWYAKQAKIAQPTLYDGHALLKPTNTPVRVHDSEESLVQAEVYWLPAKELATQKSNPPKLVTPFVHTRPTPSKFHEHVKEPVQSLDENLVKEVTEFMRMFDELDKEYEQCVLEKKKLQIEKKNILIQTDYLITDYIAKDICSIVLASDRDRPLIEELSSNCVRENSKVIELQIEILKQQQRLAESDKRFFEINQLKEQLQGKDDTIRKLQTQINSMSSFDKQALETELTQLKDVITSVRIQNDWFKIIALTAENAKLKSESLSKMHSEPIVPEKPKVLAPGMYAISSKYIAPP
nr:hypothetical protein [Tanacetum cinerariifolium]